MANNDWYLWMHDAVRGTDFIRDFGSEEFARKQMERLDKEGRDVWIVDPSGNKHLPTAPPSPQDAEKPSCGVLRSKPMQIQAVSQPGDCNSGPHVQLFALCEDGSIWVQYHSSGFSNVPTDGLWHMIQPPAGFQSS